MTATGHALIGLALAAQIPNPVIGIPIAIVSHIAADAFPHWDTGTTMHKKSKRKFVIQSFIDLGISLTFPFILLYYLFPETNFFYTFIMILAAQGFDWGAAPLNFLGWNFPPFSWVHEAQKSFDHKLDKPWGVILQVLILLTLLAIAKFY